jgi:DNA segregation ATPase FtsK/SpoIIIE, S-DNA-T family
MKKTNKFLYLKPFRRYPNIIISPITLRKPPTKFIKENFDIIPSLVTFLVSAATFLVFYFITGTFLWFFLIFPVIMLVQPLVQHSRSNKKNEKKFQEDLTKYNAYLDDKSKDWAEKNAAIEDYFNEANPSPQEISTIIKHFNGVECDNLWNRLPEHDDFLTFRIGTFSRPTHVQVNLPEDTIDSYPTIILKKFELIKNQRSTIEKSPLLVDLKKTPFICVKAKTGENLRELFSAFITNLAFSHAYDNVKFMFLGPKANDVFRWIRWLPHFWDGTNEYRRYSESNSDNSEILDILETIVMERIENKDNSISLPEYIVIIEDEALFFSHSVSRFFTSTTNELGISIIFIVTNGNSVPSICSKIIDTDNNCLIDSKQKTNIGYVSDTLGIHIAENITRILSNIELVNGDKTPKLPDVITFFDLIFDNQSHTIHENWVNTYPYESLNVPIGIKSDGKPLIIDMKDGADGPHGIIAGMTGSGKTELLQTLVMSLCVSYSPEMVNFAFVDFKEGGMASQFEGMPHVSGILTNKGNNVAYLANRAINMLKQEKKYRGEILNDFNLDIDVYHKKFFSNNREDLVPLPHLFVIIDESAEVVDQFREFMREMVSLARVGRSMGIHLILSTQNPSRTVDQQIFDNSNLKICLYVLSEEESSAILGTKDAAHLKNRGRAYLKTGNGTRYEIFQGGWTGATVSSFPGTVGMEPTALLPDGSRTRLVSKIDENTSDTQLKAVTSELFQYSSLTPKHVVFSKTLGYNLNLHDIDGESEVIASNQNFVSIIGKADFIDHQAIKDVILNFDKCRNVVIYGASRSGKTTLMEAILLDIIQRYSPNNVECIVIANGASSMNRYKNSTFVNEVLEETDFEKLYRLPKILINECKRRLAIIQSIGCDNISEYETHSKRNDEKLRRIVVFIDSLRQYPWIMNLTDVFAAGSGQVGIHIIASYQDSSLPRNMVSDFGGRIALQIHDELYFKYEIPFKGIIENYPGRGIFTDPTLASTVEMQSFQPSLINRFQSEADEMDRSVSTQSIKDIEDPINFLNQKFSNTSRNKARFIIPTASDLLSKMIKSDSELTMGVFYESLKYFSLTCEYEACMFSVIGREDRENLKHYLEERLRRISGFLFYGDDKVLPEEDKLRADIDDVLDKGTKNHLFMLLYFEKDTSSIPDFKEKQEKLINLAETIYRNKISIIVITSARRGKLINSINEYCLNANRIVAIGGKHDSHAIFSDVSTKIINIPQGEAYVSTSSKDFERVIFVPLK